MRNPVRSHKVKYDGSGKGPWEGDLVDAIGERWLVVFYEPPPQRTSAGNDAAFALRYHGMDCPLSVLVYFDHRGDVLEYHCDAALPATISGRDIRFVDLDIDVIADASLATHERDHEQFAANRERMGYDNEAIAAAEAGVALAYELMRTGATPFDGHPAALLGRLLAAQGPL
ncbi:MAG: DUF402 domain-containing protein [Dehalococcoidia bacterium]|nr:DUF402 domain-containing protein [Dehalococcoidia bacterium]